MLVCFTFVAFSPARIAAVAFLAAAAAHSTPQQYVQGPLGFNVSCVTASSCMPQAEPVEKEVGSQ